MKQQCGCSAGGRGLRSAGGACAVRVRCCYLGVPSPPTLLQLPSAPKAGGRRRRGGYPQQPTAAAAGYRQPPGLLRRAAVPIGPNAILLCKPPATRATAALAAKPGPLSPPNGCHYPHQASDHSPKTHSYVIVRKTDSFFACCFRVGFFAWGISR